MRPHDDPDTMTADQRLREVAAILAAGRRLAPQSTTKMPGCPWRPFGSGETMLTSGPLRLRRAKHWHKRFGMVRKPTTQTTYDGRPCDARKAESAGAS
jgi:hypothetical protein